MIGDSKYSITVRFHPAMAALTFRAKLVKRTEPLLCSASIASSSAPTYCCVKSPTFNSNQALTKRETIHAPRNQPTKLANKIFEGFEASIFFSLQ